MKRIILLAAVLALWAQSVQAQQWQPTTWPPTAPNGCVVYVEMPTGTPDLCGGLAEMQVTAQAFDYSMANGADQAAAVAYAQRQAQQWNQQTGRYDNESWMWQPAPQNQQQWQQRRGGR